MTDPLDPRGPMGMPKIVSRAANRLGHGQRGGGNLVAGIYLLSVLAIIIALGIFFIACLLSSAYDGRGERKSGAADADGGGRGDGHLDRVPHAVDADA